MFRIGHSVTILRVHGSHSLPFRRSYQVHVDRKATIVQTRRHFAFWARFQSKWKLKGSELEESPSDVAKSRSSLSHGQATKVPNPFSYDTPMTPYEWAKVIVCGLTLAPIRVILLIPTLTALVFSGKLAVVGLKPEDIVRPPEPWRKKVLSVTRLMLRTSLFLFGFHRVSVIGKPAPREEAPIVVSNHVSFVDPLFFFALLFPSFVAKKSISKIPFIGNFFAVTCFLVERTDSASKHDTVVAIKRRAELCYYGETYKGRKYRPILIYPEGTTTNGLAMIGFKAGAFSAGLPVQPVCISYPHKHFNPAWTAAGPGVPLLALRMLCQVYNRMEIKYLDVYHPSEQEKQNPLLYAKNVRDVMARAMNIPTTEHSYEDVLLMVDAIARKLPSDSTASVELHSLRMMYDVNLETAKELLRRFSSADQTHDGKVDYEEFCKWLQLSRNAYTLKLFQLFDVGNTGSIDFKEFVVSLSRLSKNMKEENVVEIVFQALDKNYDGRVSLNDLQELLGETLPKDEVSRIFHRMDTDQVGLITVDQFMSFCKSNPEYVQLVQYVISRQQPELGELTHENFE